jgi:hypothetical protein
MTLCPMAIAAGCRKCPVFSVCPLKSIIGDYKEKEEPKPKTGGADGAGSDQNN